MDCGGEFHNPLNPGAFLLFSSPLERDDIYLLSIYLSMNKITNIPSQTQTAMEEWAIENIRSALETGKLKSPVPEQADL